MKKNREQEIARRLRAAVEQQTPDRLEELLRAVDSLAQQPQRRVVSRPAPRVYFRRAAVVAGLAAACTLLISVRPTYGMPTPPFSPTGNRPTDSSALLEETGFVMKAYAASPGEDREERVLVPNQPVLLNGSAGGVGFWPSAVAVGDGNSQYKVHIPFDVVCQGENLVSVQYRTNQGQFEQKLTADREEEVAELTSKVRLVNRDETGAAWGYAPMGRELTLAAQEQETLCGTLSLELSFTGRENAPAYYVETVFRHLIEDVEILVTLTFADGSTGETLLQFGPGVFDGGVEATLVTGFQGG